MKLNIKGFIEKEKERQFSLEQFSDGDVELHIDGIRVLHFKPNGEFYFNNGRILQFKNEEEITW